MLPLFFWLCVSDVLSLSNQQLKIMDISDIESRFLDDEYQAKQFELQQKTPYRERNPKQEDVIKLHKPIDMVDLASKIFLI